MKLQFSEIILIARFPGIKDAKQSRLKLNWTRKEKKNQLKPNWMDIIYVIQWD